MPPRHAQPDCGFRGQSATCTQRVPGGSERFQKNAVIDKNLRHMARHQNEIGRG